VQTFVLCILGSLLVEVKAAEAEKGLRRSPSSASARCWCSSVPSCILSTPAELMQPCREQLMVTALCCDFSTSIQQMENDSHFKAKAPTACTRSAHRSWLPS